MDNGEQRFGDVEFHQAQRRLIVAGRAVELDRSCIAILTLLLKEAGRDVDKDRLLEAGWPGRVVHENSLAKAIGRLRTALDRDGRALETVHGYGYRLAAEVEHSATTPTRVAPSRRQPMFLRPLFVFVAALLVGLATWSLVTPWQASGRKEVVNGEPADSIGRVLWVDDHPENNLAEKRYLEQHRIGVYQVKTTKDALTLLRMYAYGAVISDMGRNNKPLAGLELLKAIRSRGDRRPFFVYTVYSSDAQRNLVAQSGGQGVAVKREQLYAAILPLFGETPPELDNRGA